MTDQNDPNDRPRMRESRAMSWGVPLGLAALAIVAGLLFFNSDTNRTTTASNNTPAVTQTNPSTPDRPAPATSPASR